MIKCVGYCDRYLTLDDCEEHKITIKYIKLLFCNKIINTNNYKYVEYITDDLTDTSSIISDVIKSKLTINAFMEHLLPNMKGKLAKESTEILLTTINKVDKASALYQIQFTSKFDR